MQQSIRQIFIRNSYSRIPRPLTGISKSFDKSIKLHHAYTHLRNGIRIISHRFAPQTKRTSSSVNPQLTAIRKAGSIMIIVAPSCRCSQPNCRHNDCHHSADSTHGHTIHNRTCSSHNGRMVGYYRRSIQDHIQAPALSISVHHLSALVEAEAYETDQADSSSHPPLWLLRQWLCLSSRLWLYGPTSLHLPLLHTLTTLVSHQLPPSL